MAIKTKRKKDVEHYKNLWEGEIVLSQYKDVIKENIHPRITIKLKVANGKQLQQPPP